MFFRDEISVLEDELNDLYIQHGRGVSKGITTIEAQVLCEQIETEESSNAELLLKLGPDAYLHLHEGAERESGFSLNDYMHGINEFFGDPVYHHAKVWATAMREIARQQYVKGGYGRKDAFRVYANVNLVPVKIIVALVESAHGDSKGIEIAFQNYFLSFTYLHRIRESCSKIIWGIDVRDSANVLYEETNIIGKEIFQRIGRLKRNI